MMTRTKQPDNLKSTNLKSNGQNNIDISIADEPYDELSGDDAFSLRTDSHIFLSIFDAAGHGSRANKIAMAARDILESNQSQSLTALMNTLHEGLRGTNGGVGIVARLDTSTLQVNYVGIGHIFMCRFRQNSDAVSRLVLRDGIIGYQCRTPIEKTLQLEGGDVLVLHSDGIKNRIDIDDYPEILTHDANRIARNLVQRFGKSGDDATCMVVRVN